MVNFKILLCNQLVMCDVCAGIYEAGIEAARRIPEAAEVLGATGTQFGAAAGKAIGDGIGQGIAQGKEMVVWQRQTLKWIAGARDPFKGLATPD